MKIGRWSGACKLDGRVNWQGRAGQSKCVSACSVATRTRSWKYVLKVGQSHKYLYCLHYKTERLMLLKEIVALCSEWRVEFGYSVGKCSVYRQYSVLFIYIYIYIYRYIHIYTHTHTHTQISRSVLNWEGWTISNIRITNIGLHFPYDTCVWFHELRQYQCLKNKLYPKSIKSVQVYECCCTDNLSRQTVC